MKYLLIALATLIFATTLSAQQYRLFPMSGAYWIYVIDNGIGSSQWPYPRYQYIQLMFDGNDTTINGYRYKTIIRREYADSTLNNSLPPAYSNKIANLPDTQVMAIREDGKKIRAYMLPGAGPYYDTSEIVLYDFSYLIGDTIKTAIHFYNCTVTSSDSLLVGSVYHKRWITNCGAITEGIGHRWGLYNLGNGQNICSLTCFNRAGYGSYSPAGTSCFYIHKMGTPTGIATTQSAERITVSPNPFIDEIKINTDTPVELSVYNSLGQVVLSDRLKSCKTINASSLPPGTYFVELVNKEADYRQVKKMVK